MKVPAAVSFSLLCLLGLMALALQGCTFYSMRDDPQRNVERMSKTPPASMAVMPVQDSTRREGLDTLVRRSLYAALAPLHYQDVEIGNVDEALAGLSLHKNVPPLQLAPHDLAEKHLADALLYAEVVKKSRIWLLLYSHIRLRMKLRLVDPATDTVLYSNDATLYKRRFSLPTSISGIAESWVETLWDIRNGETGNVLDEFAERIAKEFPDPAFANSGDGGIDGVFVSVPGPVLRAGDSVKVEVRGRTGQKGAFDVGNKIKNLALTESTPGLYTGAYRIVPGDLDDTGIVRAHLQSSLGNEVTMSNLKGGFRIDAVPPERPEIQDVQFVKNGVCLHLRLPQLTEGTLFEIYRAEDPKEGYAALEQVTALSWVDRHVKAGRRYWYLVKALDAGGNVSMHSEVKAVDVPQKGPTILPTAMNGVAVLHAYSSPYRVFQTVTVGSDTTLVVEPGVEIQIWPGARIRIRGNARLDGLPEKPIRITGKDGGTLLQFEPEQATATISVKNVQFKNALLALDVNKGSVTLEKAFFHKTVRGVAIAEANDLQMLQCSFDSVEAAVEGSSQRFDAQFCSFRNVGHGISMDSPEFVLRNNDFYGEGMAVSQMNATPVEVDNNYFDGTNPIALLQRITGPCTFTRIYSKPSVEKQYHSLESTSFDLCKARGDGCMQRKDAANALTAYLNAWWLRKDKSVGMRLWQLLCDRKQTAEALHVAHTLVVMEPTDEKMLSQYAHSLDESGYSSEALEVRKRMAEAKSRPARGIAE